MRSVIIVFAACLVFVGCSKEESQTTSSQTNEPSSKAAETATVAKQAEQVVDQAKEKVAEAAEQAKEKAAEATEQAKEKVGEVTEQAEEKATQVKAKAQDLLASVPNSFPAASNSISGESIYSKSCSSCHKAGIIGAPKTGDKTAWAPLISGGLDKLVQNSINGLGKMPPRGGNSKLTDEEVKAAVEYMVEQSE